MSYERFEIRRVPELSADRPGALKPQFMNMVSLAIPALVLREFGTDEMAVGQRLRKELHGTATIFDRNPVLFETDKKTDDIGLHIDSVDRHTAVRPDFTAWILLEGSAVGTFFWPKKELFEDPKSWSYASTDSWLRRYEAVSAMNDRYRRGEIDTDLVTPIAYRTAPLVQGDVVLFAAGRIIHDLKTLEYPRKAVSAEYNPVLHGSHPGIPLVHPSEEADGTTATQ